MDRRLARHAVVPVPDDDKEIKRGAQLIVRESQVGAVRLPRTVRRHVRPRQAHADDRQHPGADPAQGWKYGFESPFKADVYYVITRVFTGNKWGTSNPVMMRDADFGIVRMRAFGTYDFRVVDPKRFLKEVAGTDQHFRLDEFADAMRSRMVSVFSDALASAKVPALDVATRYTELGEALLPLINPVLGEKYGLEMTSFILENVSVPAEVEAAIDKRSSMAAVGNLNDYVKYQMAQGLEKGGTGVGAHRRGDGGRRVDRAADGERARRYRRADHAAGGGARPRRPLRRGQCRRRWARPTPRNCSASRRPTSSPASKPGDLKGKKIGTQWRIRDIGDPRISEADRPPSASSRCPISNVTAREKFACPACGADAQWNPAKQALVCPFCGTESPATLQKRGAETVIVEHDLVAALRDVPDAAAAGRPTKVSVQCQSCQAISVFDPSRVGQRCEFCGSSQLVPYEQVKEPFSPESLLPFAIPGSQARDLMRGVVRAPVARANKLPKRALTDTVRGVYLPYWTFDAQVHANWRADSGRYYYVEVNNKREQRVEWTPAAGELDHFFDDELVAASTGVDPGCCAARTVSDRPADPVRSRLPRRMDRRALSDRSGQRGDAVTRDDGKQDPAALLGGGPGRHAAQPRGRCGVLGSEVQAHPRAGLAAHLHLRRDGLPGGGERRHRQDRRRSALELDQDRAVDHRDHHRADRVRVE